MAKRTTPTVNSAVENCIRNLAIAQQNHRAFAAILARLRNRNNIPQDAQTAIYLALHEEVNQAWNDLAWFAPINRQAMELLAERTRTWFDSPNAGVMHWLGYDGSYYTADKEAFVAEVQAMFTGVPVSAPQTTPIVQPHDNTVTPRQLREALFHIENQALTVGDLRRYLFNVDDQDEPVAVDAALFDKLGIE